MFSYALNIISYAINSCIVFFLRLEGALGFVSVLIGVFIAYTATRLFLIPIIGGASSDVVRSALPNKKTNNNNKGS